MKLGIFTSNHPRHLSLVRTLSSVSDEIIVIQEAKTMFPGQVGGIFSQSEIVADYFKNVSASEQEVFGKPQMLPSNVRQLVFAHGDINYCEPEIFNQALESDMIIVFGASYIKGELVERLIEQGALNIHMGLSPYYRGNSCNFWPLYDGRPEFVGATIHKLTKGLDSGDIFFHALPKAEPCNPFVLGMKAVASAHRGLAYWIDQGKFDTVLPVKQRRDREIRYTRARDFTDDIIRDYQERTIAPKLVEEKLATREERDYINAYVSD